jgi:glycosyltransferase involved in cell wall biosynthesis
LNADSLKIAIVHDWLVTYAGADRVVDQLHQLFPGAPIYTLVYDRKQMPERFKTYDIRTTRVQKIPFATKLYKNMLTLMPGAFERLDLTEYDLVISSCSSCSKGVITRPDAVHICYCHTPTRYIWDFYYTYLRNAGSLKRLMIPRMVQKMRLWDRLAADRVDYFVANSNFIAQRIRKYYRRESTVIYPCVHISEIQPVDTPDDYYLTVSRFTYYKRVDVAIQACNRLGKRLVVVGAGDEGRKLRALAGPTVEFRGAVPDEEVRRLYSRAKAFLFPGEEDFGITPVEAQSAGCPVLAYGKGGALETVQDGKTGLFFPEQNEQSLAECIKRFEKDGVACTRAEIRAHSLRFSEERFREEMSAYCGRILAERQHDVGNRVP